MRFDGGWIKVYRTLDNHWIGNDGVALAVFVKMVMWANREPTKLFREGKLITVERGQLLTSSYELADKLGFERKTIERRLEAMAAEGTIVQKVSHRGRLITICNYEEYQKNDKAPVPDLSHSSPTEGATEAPTEDSTEGATEDASIGEGKNSKKERRKEGKKVATHPSGDGSVPAEVKPTSEVWQVYSECFAQRYNTTPKRNAAVNGKLAQFVKRLGAEDAKAVVRFYFTHTNYYYVKSMHSIGPMLSDCEKLFAEMNSKVRITDGLSRQVETLSNNEQVIRQFLQGGSS